MIATNYTKVRDNMKKYLDEVTENFETVFITRKNDKNAVLISEETFNNLLENLHLVSDKANFDWLMESKKQLDSKKIIKKKIEDLK